MEYIIFKKGFYIIGKSREILFFLRQKAVLYETVSEMLANEII